MHRIVLNFETHAIRNRQIDGPEIRTFTFPRIGSAVKVGLKLQIPKTVEIGERADV